MLNWHIKAEMKFRVDLDRIRNFNALTNEDSLSTLLVILKVGGDLIVTDIL